MSFTGLPSCGYFPIVSQMKAAILVRTFTDCSPSLLLLPNFFPSVGLEGPSAAWLSPASGPLHGSLLPSSTELTCTLRTSSESLL